ncbi:hypothetical protein BU17DRAFT_102635 [Hysterangium stoloniferum]|nr:hypothetical protein BU17DRAFT_102635 [Hysterangium stoloniferum]
MSEKAATHARLETHARPSRYQPIVLRRQYERLTSAVEPLPRTAGTNTQPQVTHPVPYALTQLPPRIKYLSKAGIVGYPRSNHHARPHDIANLLHYIHSDSGSTSKQKMTRVDAGLSEYICEELLRVFLFRHREFFVDSSDEGFEHGGFDGFLEYGEWRRGWTRGLPSMALGPRPHQHFDEGRDTGGVRWLRGCDNQPGSKELHEYDGLQDDSTCQDMTSFLVHDKPNNSLSAYTHNCPSPCPRQ